MKIEPCPWLGVVEHQGKHPCGLTVVPQNGEPKTGSPVSYAVMCLGCGAMGPSEPTRMEAIKAWNQTVREVEGKAMMNANSPIVARLVFWPIDREAVWLKAQFTPKTLAEMCHNGDCPLEGFVTGYDTPCPVHDCTKDENVTANDWIKFLSVGAPIGGGDEKR